jgi:type IV pilus biogenesis protein CpaD/CtpE
MMRPTALLLPLLLALPGCTQTDPYQREGNWRPNGANAANLRAMVAVPADLTTAMPAGPADGTLAAAALNRLRHDRVLPLPDSGVAQIVPVSGESTAQPAVTPAAGSGN